MVYKWYILPIGGLYATYHLLGEPETTTDHLQGGPLQVINGVITLFIGVISPSITARGRKFPTKTKKSRDKQSTFHARHQVSSMKKTLVGWVI